MKTPKNVLGGTLQSCCHKPVTGYYRDGFCRTDETDVGAHVVCIRATDEFLAYSKANGNDLSTPRPEFDFPGLVSGNCWCLCASRWADAHNDGVAPPVLLEATHERVLDYVDLDVLRGYAWERTGQENNRHLH